jgi:hypothetical protein
MKEEMRTIIGGTVFILLFAMFSSFIIGDSSKKEVEAAQGSWACTTDIYICPDGSEVSRTPPYCKFASCPN